MSKLITVEVCTNGTLTRANARALNRALGTAFSGTTLAVDAIAQARTLGHEVRTVQAAALTGADKGAHTREVNRSRKAQARRGERKADQFAAWAAVTAA